MTFKKDYINYLLYTVVNSPQSEFKENYRLCKLVDSIIAVDDVLKITYLLGKTAGLELLFKYLLYISDKIDKSQVTIFNLQDNFEYDKLNIKKICSKINIYKSENVQDAIKEITSEKAVDFSDEKSAGNQKETIKINTEENESSAKIVELDDIENTEFDEEENEKPSLMLIENPETYTGEAEVFELESITEAIENPDKAEEFVEENTGKYQNENESLDEETGESSPIDEKDLILESEESEITDGSNLIENTDEGLPDIVIEVHKPLGASQESEHVREEAITNEAYIKFETKFFEEVKILEKLLASVSKERSTESFGSTSEKNLQCITEILGITSELSNLSRQLSFDLIADIFLTMNIYFTKSISNPQILNDERIKLLDSSLALVNSLIKGEDYLNYDTIVEKIEKLKNDISGEDEEEIGEEFTENDDSIKEQLPALNEIEHEKFEKENDGLSREEYIQQFLPKSTEEKPAVKQSQIETAVFKLKYLIREFEKSFAYINDLKGEYSRFDAIEKISDLYNALRLIAKISAAIKYNDVLKLAEVTYVFLKYVKDYRMDMQEPEIQQIIKYIIFTFKMLLTERKPEDFNVLVQHLNNPVKIFTDS
ncbi:MAG: hypothetical protein IT280_03910 [Ignavibacteria bacterium]|nr:hypothetical protein [Ignavibacteria bacterium]